MLLRCSRSLTCTSRPLLNVALRSGSCALTLPASLQDRCKQAKQAEQQQQQQQQHNNSTAVALLLGIDG
jgi:hypothetical protein